MEDVQRYQDQGNRNLPLMQARSEERLRRISQAVSRIRGGETVALTVVLY
jgi:hypothetical protein